ncbi:MAG TPA: hypothetical protein VGX95_07455 [Xanthobacteraceae bacterium]|jgi:hypothetical protein|nr:hypothetical protein [Xanthobacteraceae bacterium]
MGKRTRPRRHSPVVLALMRVHLDLTRKLARGGFERPSVRVDLWHVECVIRMFEPNTTVGYRRKPNPWFKHGTLFRAAVEVLRAAERPMHTREIVAAIIQRKGIQPDILSIADLMKSVERSLVYHEGRSIVAVGSHPVHWKPAD